MIIAVFQSGELASAMFSSWPKSPGVYAITCAVTGGQYVGATINLRKRLGWHFGQLALGKHSSKRLQADYVRYGSPSFSAQVLQLVPGGDRLDVAGVEYEWTKKLNPVYGGTVGGNPLEKLAVKQKKMIGYALRILDEAIDRSLLPHKSLGEVSFVEYYLRLKSKADWLRALPSDYFTKCPTKTRHDIDIWEWVEGQWMKEFSVKPVAQFGMGCNGTLYG